MPILIPLPQTEAAIEHRKTTISSEDLFAVEDILEEWEILRAITKDKQHRCEQMDKESRLEAKFGGVGGGGGNGGVGAATKNSDNYVSGMVAAGDMKRHSGNSRQQQQKQQQQKRFMQQQQQQSVLNAAVMQSSTSSSTGAADSAYPTSATSSLSLNRPTPPPLPSQNPQTTSLASVASNPTLNSNVVCGKTGSNNSAASMNSRTMSSTMSDRFPDAFDEKEEEEEEGEDSMQVVTSTPIPDHRHPRRRHRHHHRRPVSRPEGVSTLTESLDSSFDEDRLKEEDEMLKEVVDGGVRDAAAAAAADVVVDLGSEELCFKESRLRSRPLSPMSSIFTVPGRQ